MEISQLRYALAVADHGTFTAAAAACLVAQPSLSHAVRALERDLGVELFHRIGRRTTLTSAGEAFVPAARAALRSLEALREEVESVKGLLAGRLHLVALPTLAVDPVTPLVGEFRRAHPGVTVRLAHPDSTVELLDMVRRGESEVGITELPVADPQLIARPLARQELVAILPPGTPVPKQHRIGLAELAARALVTLPRGTSTRDALDAALAAEGVEATVAVETDQREVLVPLVLAGAGSAVVPAPMAVLAAREGAVRVTLTPRLWREVGIIARSGPLSPAARAFLELAAG
jgi:DNA-binding transcriptional LysR family regulator